MLDLEKTAQRYGAQSIEIHDWDGSGLIEVRARRPGLYNMASMGFIPNPLLGAMQAMFSGNTAQINAVDAKKQGECLTAIARYARQLRHSYASMLHAAGVERNLIGTSMGHTNFNTTDGYIDIEQARMNDVRNAGINYVLNN